MALALSSLILTSMMAILVTAIAGIGYVIRMWKSGLPILKFEDRQPVPWGLIDLVLIFVVFILCQIAAIPIARNYFGAGLAGTMTEMTIQQRTGFLVVSSVSSLMTFFIAIFVVQNRTRATFKDLGMTPLDPFRDLFVGFGTFAVVILPVFGLQAILMQFFKPEHPLIKMLLKEATPTFFFVSCFLAVIVAPFVEEFLFRVLFQGWMENLAAARSHRDLLNENQITSIFMGGWRRASQPNPQPISQVPVAELVSPNLAESTEDTLIAFSPPKGEAAAEQLIATADLPMVKKWWPIIISSFAFAMAHFGHGTDPIPLFLVALGLGWLYQRTHRLWPCVVVHMALNGFSMLQLAQLIFVGDPTALQ